MLVCCAQAVKSCADLLLCTLGLQIAEFANKFKSFHEKVRRPTGSWLITCTACTAYPQPRAAMGGDGMREQLLSCWV